MNLFSELVNKNIVYNGDFLKLRLDQVKLPNNKQTTREFVSHPGAACVLAIDDDDNILVVKQHRYPISKITYEIPAGKLDLGEKPEDCALRELEEETGYKAGKLDLLGVLHPAPAYTTEIIYIYLASNLSKGQVNLDDEEFLVSEKININKILEMILDNKITDAKTQVAILKYFMIYKTNKKP
ncbi:MAG: NUDIX hydrolase [Oscillospiraceae bacterium]|nr:NUDIX hydrolase [Oscillospiraceae bacterium]